MRARALLVAVLLAAVAALGAGDVLAFDHSAAGLQQQIAGYEAAGMPADEFSAAEQRIAGWERQLLPHVPYSSLSGAAFRDPLLDERAAAKARWAAWSLRQQQTATEAALSVKSGGFTDGEPADVETMSAQLDQAMTKAQKLKLELDPGLSGQDLAAGYWLLPRQTQLDLHDLIKQQLGAAISAMQSRIAAKQQAQDLLSQAQTLLGDAEWQGTATAADEQGTAAAAAAVKAASTDAQLALVTQALQKLLATLAADANQQSPQPPLPTTCLTGVPAQLIEVHIATQELIAYRDGCPWLATWVTTGEPALATVQGTFHIFYKARWFLMQSPWPYGSPYWYPNTWVGYAMEIYNDGTFIHTADWEPPGAFGRGSQYGPYASHGCIHVQDGPAATLFAWAGLGTEVIVGQ